MAVPGELEAFQTYNDTWRGWPVLPLKRQHPIRGSFLDPRPDPRRGAIYHTGVDIAVRDDRPERGAPPVGRTACSRSRAGACARRRRPAGSGWSASATSATATSSRPCPRPVTSSRRESRSGGRRQGFWHVHLTEFLFAAGGETLTINPLRRGGKLHPYVDRHAPEIREIRFYTPATPRWGRRRDTTVALLPQAGRRLAKTALAGKVDVRVRVSDPQTFIGWFRDLPHLAAPHHPFRLSITVVRLATGRVVLRREAFRAEQLLDQPAGQHFAPGTEQNLPASACMLFHRTMQCDGIYWFRLFPSPYWNTARLPDGRYRLRIRAWDVAGNMSFADTVVTLRNRGV